MIRNKCGLAIPLLLLLAFSATAVGATVPTPSSLSASYVSGRQAKLQWRRVSVSGATVHYDVYRDDEKLATVIDGENDPETDGQVWYYSINYQYFFDNSAWPGKTHAYKVVATVGADSSSEITRSLAIPVPSFPSISAAYETGRSVHLSWNHIGSGFSNSKYRIFRDDVELAEFQGKTGGSATNGDTWSSGVSQQNYYDNNVFPGRTHTYKIIATLFEESEAVIQTEKQATVPLPSFPAISFTYQGGRAVRVHWKHVGSGFSGVNYQVYRDGVARAQFQEKTVGTGENGDSWDYGVTNQNYYDSGAYPGQSHTYRVVATLFPGCDISKEVDYAVPSTAFNSISISYPGVRTVQLSWNRLTSPDFNAVYTVYRDGDALATFDADVAGSADNGDSWKMQSSTQYYYDTNAWPGKAHTYEVVARLFPGCELRVEKEYQVPHTILPSPTFTYQSGRNVQLSWTKIASHPTFDTIQYTVFRDETELASFVADTEGTGANNDSWRSDNTKQYYVDGTAIPWETHAYRVEARLFTDCQVTRAANYTVPGPKVAAPSPTVMSVGSVSLKLGTNSANSFSDASLEIYRNGQLIDILTPTNNAFPTTYLDTGINVPNGPHYYQFLFRLYPGCDSGLSAQFPLTVPTPQTPTLSIVKNEVGAVTLRCAGANISTPQCYEIYRDGLFLATTTTGTSVDYVDDAAESGRLVGYEARTRFDQFPPSYVSAKCKSVYVATLLGAGQPYSAISPLGSIASPAWIEGDSASVHLPIEFAVGGVNQGPVFYFNDTSWYANTVVDPNMPMGIPLDPTRPVAVRFTGHPENTTYESTMNLSWLPTDLCQRIAGEPALQIRKGDSLLLTASGTGSLLEIDGDGDGVYELSGVPGQEFPVAFNASGQFTVSAKIDGLDAGSLRVAVAAVILSKDLSYVRSSISGDTITMTSEQPRSLYPDMLFFVLPPGAVTLSSSSTTNAVRITVSSSSASFVGTHLQARLHHSRGPLLAECEVRVLVQSIEGRSYSPVLRKYADGSRLFGNCVTLKNPFPDAALKLSLTNAGPVFADTGTSIRIVSAEEFDQNNQANVYIISSPDSASSAGYTIMSEIVIDEN